jgi:hypothetical protein
LQNAPETEVHETTKTNQTMGDPFKDWDAQAVGGESGIPSKKFLA